MLLTVFALVVYVSISVPLHVTHKVPNLDLGQVDRNSRNFDFEFH